MSLLTAATEQPGGLLEKYWLKATDIIQNELQKDNSDSGPMVGWFFGSLAEAVAYAFLEEAGYHQDMLDALIDGEYPDGWGRGDLEAELERTRNKPELVSDTWWLR